MGTVKGKGYRHQEEGGLRPEFPIGSDGKTLVAKHLLKVETGREEKVLGGGGW